MDLEMIKKIIKVAEQSDISGLSVEKGDFKVEVRREKGLHPVPSAPVHQAVHPAHAAEGEKPKPDDAKTEEDDFLVITSPMVGTFYRAASPDSQPYIQPGDVIEKGKVVCVIEAMKLFNEIESEVGGKVEKILVENGKPVEYGQKLVLIRKV